MTIYSLISRLNISTCPSSVESSPMPPYLKRAAGRLAVGIGLASVAGVAGVVGLARADEGFARSLAFWRRAFPIYAHYRWAEFRCGAGPEAEYDKALLSLHKRYADEALQIILDMRGFYVKIGQMGSNAMISSTKSSSRVFARSSTASRRVRWRLSSS